MTERTCDGCKGSGRSPYRDGKCINCWGSGKESICDRIIRESNERDRLLAVAEPGEHFFSLPRCPYCGATEEEWWDGHGLQNDDDTTEMECGRCERPYSVTLRVSHEFKTAVVDSESKDGAP
jgi:hypothetical protein